MISMSLEDFTNVVRRIEDGTAEQQSASTQQQSASPHRKLNGMSPDLAQYLDKLSDPAFKQGEVERLSSHVSQLLADIN
jgi:hypothetical protein